MFSKRLILIGFILPFKVFSSGYIHSLDAGGAIDKYQILGNGGLVVWMKEQHPKNPDNCTMKSHVYIKSSLPQYKDILALVMSAHAQGNKIGFWSSGCTTTYFWGPAHTLPEIRDAWTVN